MEEISISTNVNPGSLSWVDCGIQFIFFPMQKSNVYLMRLKHFSLIFNHCHLSEVEAESFGEA